MIKSREEKTFYKNPLYK